MRQIMAFFLAAMMLLSGGTAPELVTPMGDWFTLYLQEMEEKQEVLPEGEPTRFSDMVYTRPDMDAWQELLERNVELAGESDSVDAVIDGVWEVYDAYDWFYTAYYLADIHYCMDMTDSYWEEEYYYCMAQSPQVDADMEDYYTALAASPLRKELEGEDYFGEGFFEAYDGEDGGISASVFLLEEESQLISQYYSIVSEAMEETEFFSAKFYRDYAPQLAQVYVELVSVRQEIARDAGYDSYPEFAYDYYYSRDYTPEQAMDLMEEISRELSQIYEDVDGDIWDYGYANADEEAVFDFVSTAASAMGGQTAEGFAQLEELGLYDISYNRRKTSTSFEIFLTSYQAPFVFVSPYGEALDKLTFAHEFGHYMNDYATGGSYIGTDVAEVFSQGLEFLSLCYNPDADLERYKLADSLCVYIEQSAYATFEHRVYGLTGSQLTAENILELYTEVGEQFNLDAYNWDPRTWVGIEHFFTSPMYIISYVVSNDVAMQIYQLEQEQPGAGLQTLEDNYYRQDSYIIDFAESLDLESPFAPGRIQAVRQTMEENLR